MAPRYVRRRSNVIMNDQEKWTPLTTFITPFSAFRPVQWQTTIHQQAIHLFTTRIHLASLEASSVSHWANSGLLLFLPGLAGVRAAAAAAGRQDILLLNIELGTATGSVVVGFDEEQDEGEGGRSCRQQITLSGCRAVHIDGSPATLCLQWHKIYELYIAWWVVFE